MIGYVPAGELVTAVVDAVAGVLKLAALSLPTNPEYVTVKAGFAEPYTFELLTAVTVTTACVTVNVPATYVKV